MTCTRCTAPTAEGIHLCHACTTRLEEVLDRIPEALTNIQTTVARMDRIGAGTTTSGNRPEAVNVSALDEKIDLTEKIHSWARMVLEHEGRDDLRNVEPVAYLRMSVHIIRANDWAGELLDELEQAVRTVERITDRPEDRKIYGTCGVLLDDGSTCSANLTAAPEAERATCRWCGSQHDLDPRREAMRAKAKGDPLPPRECCAYLTEKTGVRVTGKDIDNWRRRGTIGHALDYVGTDGREKRIYFPGDVFKAHHEMSLRKRVAA